MNGFGGWLVVLLAVVVMGLVRRRRHRPIPQREDKLAGLAPRIEGWRVTAGLHPRMGNDCLRDHGMTFGPGFKRQLGPTLPHPGDCRCQLEAVSFSAADAMAGRLREPAVPQGFPGLSGAEAKRLLEDLRGWVGQPVPASPDLFLQEATKRGWGEPLAPDLAEFLMERYRYLTEPPNTPVETGPLPEAPTGSLDRSPEKSPDAPSSDSPTPSKDARS
ncbi:MAG: hypothetical protein OEV94_04965 [Deltaproteobacteria bacterium]|nr:hypothetical protein [Deltaproteobacteria bacterium]